MSLASLTSSDSTCVSTYRVMVSESRQGFVLTNIGYGAVESGFGSGIFGTEEAIHFVI